jgi:hypothetical protein
MGTRVERRQRGLTLIGFGIVLSLLAVAAMFVFKVTPAWVEYWGVKKAISSMSSGGVLAKTPGEIRTAFDRHAEVGYITVISGKDLEIIKDATGHAVSFAYRKEIPVVANMSVVFDFEGSSAATKARKRAIE